MKILLTLLLVMFNNVFASSSTEWYRQQHKRSLNYLLENISRDDTPVGFVVASPSKVQPNYYYHWVRDAALVMRSLDIALPNSSQKETLFDDYIQLVNHHQLTPTLTGLGEPKFNPDGTGYYGPWGRPQNDGPALRAITLMHYAFNLLKENKNEYVRKYLYRNTLPARGVIKKDLEYIAHNWRKVDFCLWEEVKGHHFYTRMAQRTAMYLGAKLADELGDSGAAAWYYLQAMELNKELEKHYSARKGYIVSTINRVGGLDYKKSNLDTSIILAVNHSWVPGLSFGPNDPRVKQTAIKLVEAFKLKYPLNHNSKKIGVAMGRYPEDTYYGGNPWFLLTNAMAEYYLNLSHLSKNKKDQKRYAMQAEKFLLRVKKHMSSEGRMAEQFDMHTGFMLGAKDLTWSYASFLTVKK